jgi:hypothetical protein
MAATARTKKQSIRTTLQISKAAYSGTVPDRAKGKTIKTRFAIASNWHARTKKNNRSPDQTGYNPYQIPAVGTNPLNGP